MITTDFDTPNILTACFRPSTPGRRAVQAQLAAYNERDIEKFSAWYSDDIRLIDLKTGVATCSGKNKLIERYGTLFSEATSLHCSLLRRTYIEDFTYDEERVTGHPAGASVRAMLIYHTNEQGLIDTVWSAMEIEK